MKNSIPRITLLGNNSGRNLGDAAILASILDIISREVPGAQFYVPSISPGFINDNYGSPYNARGINILPWTGSIRLLGIPTLYCLARSDLALICDGIIFGRKLFSPHNFLITLFFLVPWAKLTRCRLICYSCGIGPFPGRLSRLMARYVINSCDLVIMRDHDSKTIAEELGVRRPIEVTGDAAFLNQVADEERARQIAAAENIDTVRPLLGINVTPYIDSWLRKDERLADKSSFLAVIAEGLALAKARDDTLAHARIVLFSTSPMDEKYSHALAAQISGAVVMDNSRYLSHDIQCIMRKCSLFAGMRFHSLVLASAVGVPVLGLIYAPKVRSYMSLLESGEYGMELKELTPETLSDTLCRAWSRKKELADRQQKIVAGLKQGAREAAATIRQRYFAGR